MFTLSGNQSQLINLIIQGPTPIFKLSFCSLNKGQKEHPVGILEIVMDVANFLVF